MGVGRGPLKRKLMESFLRMLGTEEARHCLNLHADDHRRVRRVVENATSPYQQGQASGSTHAQPPLFITGRFRSGSTLLWNIFRRMDGYTAYYEPFNERRWFLSDSRGSQTDRTHEGVSEYWSEYDGLDHLARYYREDWIRHRLYMDEQDFDFAMKAYIDELSAHASGRPVLQFNRVDFRLGWLKANYPDSPIIHIYRNPRDQWCSILGDISAYPANADAQQGFPRRFYQGMWVRDLCRQFPFLEEFRGQHQYYNFYFLWKLSYNFGCHYSDVSIAMETLTEDPATGLEQILAATGGAVPGQWPDLSFVKPAVSRWTSYAEDTWFEDIEAECEEVLEDFLR